MTGTTTDAAARAILEGRTALGIELGSTRIKACLIDEDAVVLAPPFAATGPDLAVLALMGCVQLGTGCLLATAASKHLSATELGLLALLEPILGPLWVWALLAERPGPAALTGAVIVLGAVIGNEAFAAWRGTRPTASAAATTGASTARRD